MYFYLQGKGILVTYWLLGETVDSSAIVPYRERPQSSRTQNPTVELVSHLTPFRSRLDHGSRSSSRRGSGIFVAKSPDVIRLEKDEQPLVQTHKIQRQLSDPEPVSNGVTEVEEMERSVSNSISLTVNSLNYAAQNSQPKLKLRDSQGNCTGNHKTKMGNNNWVPKISTASSFDNGTKKNNVSLKDYSSVPLLSKAETLNDSIV